MGRYSDAQILRFGAVTLVILALLLWLVRKEAEGMTGVGT